MLRKNIYIGAGARIHYSASLCQDGGKIRIGSHCRIHKGVIISTYGGSIHIGDKVSVNPYTILYGHGGLDVGDYSRIAAHCVVIPSNHIFEKRDMLIGSQGSRSEGISIGKDVWLASGVKVLDGANIADGCVIAANAVFRGGAEPYSVYAGIPAKKIKERI